MHAAQRTSICYWATRHASAAVNLLGSLEGCTLALLHSAAHRLGTVSLFWRMRLSPCLYAIECLNCRLFISINTNKTIFLPCRATTHTDLELRARALSIPTKVIHNASIMNAIGACGLQLYRFGEVWRLANARLPKGHTSYAVVSAVGRICELLARMTAGQRAVLLPHERRIGCGAYLPASLRPCYDEVHLQ